jgi:hypothetical protein
LVEYYNYIITNIQLIPNIKSVTFVFKLMFNIKTFMITLTILRVFLYFSFGHLTSLQLIECHTVQLDFIKSIISTCNNDRLKFFTIFFQFIDPKWKIVSTVRVWNYHILVDSSLP